MSRGDKFFVPLDDDDEDGGDDNNNQNASPASKPLPGSFVNDVLERKSAATASAPSAPTLKPSSQGGGGFPSHQKRRPASRFKQQQKSSASETAATRTSGSLTTQDSSDLQNGSLKLQNDDSSDPTSWDVEERRRIDAENNARLAQMSSQEIEEERRELMDSLSPGLLQRLLRRADLDSGSAEEDLSRPLPPKEDASDQTEAQSTKKKNASKPSKKVSFAEQPNEGASRSQPEDDTAEAKQEENEDDATNGEVTSSEPPPESSLTYDTVHFPRPQQPPDLDPNSPNFLTDLHEKYFPTLPSDPSKLEWMQDPSTTASSSNSNSQTPQTTAYSPTAPALSPSELRFSFTGALLAPRTAALIPVTAGLHHHSLAPSAAGYTIPELAHLSHSAFAPQRCIAFQTLGRILFRLGTGEFGDSAERGEGTVGSEESFGELARGIWGEGGRERVIEGLVRESEGKGVDLGRHVSARAYATEAVWLWRKGGGRRWKAD